MMNIKVGDSVIVKQGVQEPDLKEFEIGGWQGRVVEINTTYDKDNILIVIEWDSITLKQIPLNYIAQSEQDGLDWKNMVLYESELEKTEPRDKKENVKQTQDELSDKYYRDSLGDKRIRISKVLDNVNPDDEMKCYQEWLEYLDNELSFPIHAIVSDSEENWFIKRGTAVVIKSLADIADMYGIIASVSLKRKKYEFPLCCLKAIDKTKADFQLIDDYKTWFANR